MQLVCGGAAVLLGWAAATSGPNHFYGEPHHLERALLFFLPLLVFWSPVFLPPFVALWGLASRQYSIVPGDLSFADSAAPLGALYLGSAFLLLQVFRRQSGQTYLAALLCWIGAAYFSCGLRKLQLDWFTNEQLQFLFAASRAQGWLGSASADVVSRGAAVIEEVNSALLGITLAIELGGVILPMRRLSAVFLLLAAAGLHTGIFLVSGICFWKWVVLDLVLAGVLYSVRGQTRRRLFSPAFSLVAPILVVLGAGVFQPPVLAWYDTPLVERFEFFVTFDSGEKRKLDLAELNGYQTTFKQNRFHYLNETPALVGAYGTTSDARILGAALGARDLADVSAARAALGESYYSPEQAAVFERFIRQYFRNRNRRKAGGDLWALLKAPNHIWLMSPDAAPLGLSTVDAVTVFAVTELFRDGRHIELERRVVREVRIDGDE